VFAQGILMSGSFQMIPRSCADEYSSVHLYSTSADSNVRKPWRSRTDEQHQAVLPESSLPSHCP